MRYQDISEAGQYDVVTDFTSTDILDTEANLSVGGVFAFVAPSSRIIQDVITRDTLMSWQNEDASALSTAAGSTTNDAGITDIVIYSGNGANAFAIMILEDITFALGTSNFDIV